MTRNFWASRLPSSTSTTSWRAGLSLSSRIIGHSPQCYRRLHLGRQGRPDTSRTLLSTLRISSTSRAKTTLWWMLSLVPLPCQQLWSRRRLRLPRLRLLHHRLRHPHQLHLFFLRKRREIHIGRCWHSLRQPWSGWTCGLLLLLKRKTRSVWQLERPSRD